MPSCYSQAPPHPFVATFGRHVSSETMEGRSRDDPANTARLPKGAQQPPARFLQPHRGGKYYMPINQTTTPPLIVQGVPGDALFLASFATDTCNTVCLLSACGRRVQANRFSYCELSTQSRASLLRPVVLTDCRRECLMHKPVW